MILEINLYQLSGQWYYDIQITVALENTNYWKFSVDYYSGNYTWNTVLIDTNTFTYQVNADTGLSAFYATAYDSNFGVVSGTVQSITNINE